MRAQVIVTSYLFPGAKFDEDRLRRLAEQVGKDRLVVDVRCVLISLMRSSKMKKSADSWPCSCRRRGDKWIVAMDRWQVMTDMEVNAGAFGLCLQL